MAYHGPICQENSFNLWSYILEYRVNSEEKERERQREREWEREGDREREVESEKEIVRILSESRL